jgi:epoxyqueuosine reductase
VQKARITLDVTLLKAWALRLGLDTIGILPLRTPRYGEAFLDWIAKGYHGSMGYLKRTAWVRVDPENSFPWAKSIVVALISYKTSASPVWKSGKPPLGFLGRPWLSCYCLGVDYHLLLKSRLLWLHAGIERAHGRKIRKRVFVDTGPILERDYAMMAGLGWIGKNTCFIHPKLGSYVFLGVMLLELPCVSEDRGDSRQCGSCIRCLEACPTRALEMPYRLDSKRCIAYLTVEHKEGFLPEESQRIGPWLVGCDVCQAVCPWNVRSSFARRPEVYPDSRLWQASLRDLERLDPNSYGVLVQNKALNRVGYSQFRRNLGAVRKNLGLV